MVGIVVVSHSAKIAEGLLEMSRQVANSQQKILAVGGTAAGELGTDVTKIAEAIVLAYSGDGVAVLADIGSAVMSIGAAVEMLDPTLRSQVKLANAPLVEGTIAAVVQASIGGNLEQVVNTAEAAIKLGKYI